MESAFGRLYRTSRLASYDRGIKQVYTTFPEAFEHGDWGLKRTMPKKVQLRLATIGSIDTKEQITSFESANQQFMMVNAWKENFPQSWSPKSMAQKHRYGSDSIAGMQSPLAMTGSGSLSTERMSVWGNRQIGGKSEQDQGQDQQQQKKLGPKRNLSRMRGSEWKRFIEEARSRRSEWKNALEKGHYAPEETLAFMNASNAHEAADDGVHWLPTYHDYVPNNNELEVKGRVLSRIYNGYLVAVQGVIAHLPLQGHAYDNKLQTRDVKTFYVHKATFDSQGRPDVLLGMKPLGARESLKSTMPQRRGGSFSYNRNVAGRGRGNKAKENLDALKRITNVLTENQDNLDQKKTPTSSTSSASDEEAKKKPESDIVSDALDLLDKNRK